MAWRSANSGLQAGCQGNEKEIPKIEQTVYESISPKECFSLSVSKISRARIVKGFGGGRKGSGLECVQDVGRRSEESN